ncbi:DUF3558 domain-containing protein [Kutzneria sp. NPDC051319]|uniref:DUF3558 domain-containing protein n=1 Tax=Kutzneria sp. NPDC051319 TaxID=3155047 RepID=UPI003413B1D5
MWKPTRPALTTSRRREELPVRHHSLKIGLLAVALAAVTAGCSTPPVVGTPGPQSNGVAADGKLPSGAPHVANPLDTTRGQSAPCNVLTQAQISSLGIVATGKPSTDPTGPGCNWSDTSTIPLLMTIGTGFITASKGGLSSLYVQAESLKKAGGYFEPVDPIQGFPAVLYGQLDDRKDKTNPGCGLAVGVSDTLQFTVSVDTTTAHQQFDPCAIAKKVADFVMTNLKAGS